MALPYQTYEEKTGKKWTGGTSPEIKELLTKYNITAPAGSAEANLALQKSLLAQPSIVSLAPKASELAITGTNIGDKIVQEGKQELDRIQGIPTQQPVVGTLATTQPQLPEVKKEEPPEKQGKIKFLNTEGQSQILEGEAITPEAYQSLVNQGYFALEGIGNVPSWAAIGDIQTGRMQTESQKSRKEISNLSETMKSYFVSDVALQAQIDDISKQYETRIRSMEDINKRRLGSVQALGISRGARWTTPQRVSGEEKSMWEGVITEEERLGQERITDLQNQKTAAINAARTAAQDKNWTIFSKQLDLAKDKEKQQREELKEYNQNVIKENKKIQEQKIKTSRDAAIMDLISQGITDPIQLWDYLNFTEEGEQVGDITSEEIEKVLANLQKMTKSENLQGDVGEWQDALKSGGVPKETTLMDYIEMKKRAITLPEKEKLLSPTEAAILGVPFGTTEKEAAKKGIIPQRYKPKEIKPKEIKPKENILTQSEAKQYRLPNALVGSDEKEVLNELKQDKPPKWHWDIVLNQIGNTEAGKLKFKDWQKMWNEFRQEVLYGQTTPTGQSTPTGQKTIGTIKKVGLPEFKDF